MGHARAVEEVNGLAGHIRLGCSRVCHWGVDRRGERGDRGRRTALEERNGSRDAVDAAIVLC